MMVEDFTAYLRANGPVAAIVGTRIYAVNLPQQIPGVSNPLPAVVYTQISGRRPQTMEGATGLNDGRYQFSCQAADYKTAKQLSQAVRDALENLSGTIGSTVTLGTQLITERDTYDAVALKFMIDTDFHIWHREP